MSFIPNIDARKSLAKKLGLEYHDHMQDWEWEVADMSRVNEFIKEYSKNSISRNEKRSLMELILDSSNDLLLNKQINVFEESSTELKSLLRSNLKLHEDTIKYWITGKFEISKYLESIGRTLQIYNRILWRASKYKVPNENIALFNDLDSIEQSHLTSSISDETGTPVLLFRALDDNWTLLSTNRVISSNNGNIDSMKLKNVKFFKPKELLNFDKESFNKRELTELVAFDNSDKQLLLHAMEGSDFFAMSNILLMAKNLNK